VGFYITIIHFSVWLPAPHSVKEEITKHRTLNTMTETELSPAIPQLPTGDIEKTATFYESTLGFEIVARFPEHNHLIIRRGQAEIHFWQAPTEADAKRIAIQSSCYIRVRNIEPLFEEFKGNGAPFAYELTRQPWGMHEMQVNDPYGNAIRFGERDE
jgi:uncharacterized glyoxalase superfamily protein PhnB